LPTYVRLRSLTTGHQWDACETAARAYLACGRVEIVARRSPHVAASPRPAKPLRDLAGNPARPRPRPPRRTTSNKE